MRIIAGRHNRRKIAAPAGLTTRPILDRVKQALFDALGSRFGTLAALPPIQVLDLFCGGGTLGIEALSRGAAGCVFVDHGAEAIRCLQQNLASTGLADRASVRRGSPLQVDIAAPSGKPHELVFLDPPFPMSTGFRAGSELHRMLTRLGNDAALADRALCIWRYDSAFHAPDLPTPRWRTIARRAYGRNTLSWLIRQPAA